MPKATRKTRAACRSMRISSAPGSRPRSRAISVASERVSDPASRWSGIDLLLHEGGTVAERGPRLPQTPAESHPVSVHEGDRREIQDDRLAVGEVWLAGLADLVHPGPDHLPFQANGDPPPRPRPGHVDLEHDGERRGQAACPAGRGERTAISDSESGTWI